MTYIKNLIIALALSSVINIFSIGGTKPEIVKQDNNVEYIKLVAQGGLCGSIYVTPKSGKEESINLEARLYDANVFKEVTGSAKLPHQGLNVRYDWAGFWPNTHYRIYAYKSDGNGNKEYVNIGDYVIIENVKHNVGCVPGIGGPEADYPPLNMNKG